jgi:hypothetical protein
MALGLQHALGAWLGYNNIIFLGTYKYSNPIQCYVGLTIFCGVF